MLSTNLYLGVEFGFPGTTTGLVFAIVESFGGFLNFATAPLIARVEQDGLDPLYYTVIAVAIGLCLVNFIQFPIAFQKGPQCMLALDKPRSEQIQSVRNNKFQEESTEF